MNLKLKNTIYKLQFCNNANITFYSNNTILEYNYIIELGVADQ